ncbi:MAG: transglutaminase-like domain-containing protein, partial [Lachnospiraceae bacterium]|nr:transglutaminase-like domain-containing protein [Lachnospiraceae bacterium]
MEKYLRGFKYTDHPGDLPDELAGPSDYLDYFLLEKREGYCSYFATSFVLLARAYGIPARYVQGFCVPMGIVRNTRVSSSLAHAWPEAYIEGVGWIAFEPTPGMESTVRWNTLSDIESMTEETDDTEFTVPRPDAPDKTEETDTKIYISPSRLVMAAVFVACVVIILLLISGIAGRIGYGRLDERQKAIRMCQRSMELLRRHHLGRSECETLSEYRNRLKDEISPESLSFLDSYERILYAFIQVSPEIRGSLEDDYITLKATLRKRSINALKEAIPFFRAI